MANNSNIMSNTCILGDCLEKMKDIPDNSIDMILSDLPYNISSCFWDMVIPYDQLWKQWNRIKKENTPIVLTATQPFTSKLIMSNLKLFKYCYTWIKNTKTNHLNAKKQPLRRTEDVIIFYKKQCVYNPQGLKMGEFKNYRPNHFNYKKGDKIYGEQKPHSNISYHTNYPDNLIFITKSNYKSLHPTQKPVELFEYLIKTYSNEGDTVLDCCAGSGTTAIACINTNRNYICIEKDENYFNIMKDRITKHSVQEVLM